MYTPEVFLMIETGGYGIMEKSEIDGTLVGHQEVPWVVL